MLTLFLFQRELLQLKRDFLLCADNEIKSELLKDIALLSDAIKELKENWEARSALSSLKKE